MHIKGQSKRLGKTGLNLSYEIHDKPRFWTRSLPSSQQSVATRLQIYEQLPSSGCRRHHKDGKLWSFLQILHITQQPGIVADKTLVLG